LKYKEGDAGEEQQQGKEKRVARVETQTGKRKEFLCLHRGAQKKKGTGEPFSVNVGGRRWGKLKEKEKENANSLLKKGSSY